MSEQEWIDEKIGVEGIIHGISLMPRQISWRRNLYNVISVGRQWEQDNEVHILVELSNLGRMEVGFSCKNGWRAVKYWAPPATLA